MFLTSFAYYRGIAIVLIVLSHCYGLSGWTFASFPERVLANIITGGTALFVFISGFFFHQVFYPGFDYRKFMAKKLRKVVTPYLIWSSLALLFTFATHSPLPDLFVGPGASLWDQWIRPTVFSLITGGHFMAYWYIPFILILFLGSPLFLGFIDLPRRTQVAITGALLLCAAVIQRPVNNILVLQSVAFYLPIYLTGILCSLEKERIYEIFSDKIPLLCTGVIGLSMLQSLYYLGAGSAHKAPFVWHYPDINIFQKLLLCLLCMVVLHRYEHSENRILSTLAASSFAIFFLHGWVIKGLGLIKPWFPFVGGLWLLPLVAGLVILCSYAVAVLIKKQFARHSSLLIGW
ncbi:acyltransferase family protein [Desulfobulbus propionicus]